MTQKANTKASGRQRKITNTCHPKSRLGPTKSDNMKTLRQGQKRTGENSLTSNERLPLSSIHPSPLQLQNTQSPPGDSNILPGESEQLSHKIKLQLFPIDKVTRKGLEQEGYNPHLELSLKPEKKISSVVDHLNIKWASSKLASGELMLLPLNAGSENQTYCSRWTSKDTEISAADVYTSLGRPVKFRLSYGWVSHSETRAGRRAMDSVKSAYDLKLGRHFNTYSDENRQLSPASCQDLPGPPITSLLQRVNSSSSLDKSLAAKDNHNADIKGKFLWNNSLSNISFGAILSELSENHSNLNCPVSTDSFDAALASLVAQHPLQPIDEPIQASRSSILEAEETRHPFSFTKITAAQENASSRDHLHIRGAEKFRRPGVSESTACNTYQDLSAYAELQRKNNDVIEQVASIRPD